MVLAQYKTKLNILGLLYFYYIQKHVHPIYILVPFREFKIGAIKLKLNTCRHLWMNL